MQFLHMQKELELPDKQFGSVAAAADAFADSLATDTKGAMDQLIDGLANGKTKLLVPRIIQGANEEQAGRLAALHKRFKDDMERMRGSVAEVEDETHEASKEAS